MMTEQIPAVLIPLDDHMGLDIARSLGKRGIPVYGVDSDTKVVGKYSSYCKFLRSPSIEIENGAAYLQFLVNIGKKLGNKPVLYPLSDEYVLFLSRERSTLQKYFSYVMPEDSLVVSLATKDGLQQIAEKYHIPAPRTVFLEQDASIEDTAERMSYPVILKPAESTYWHVPQITRTIRKGMFAARPKVILCKNAEELMAAYHRIASLDNRLVIQEVIPGEDERLVYFSFYLDRQSKPLGTFAGRKYRVIPTGFGSASYVRSMHDPELEQAARKLLDAVGYCGLGGIEFKRDPRDDRYKLIEFNARFGMWDGLGAVCGVDLAYLAYRDAQCLPVEAGNGYQDGIIWVDWQRDTRAAMEYFSKGELTFGEWVRSYRGKKMWAIYSKDDWRPGAAFTLSLAGKLWERVRQH